MKQQRKEKFYLSNSFEVVGDIVKVSWYVMMIVVFSKNVANSRARNFQNLSTAKPQFERKFVMFSIPYLQTFVIASKIKKIIFSDSKCSALKKMIFRSS